MSVTSSPNQLKAEHCRWLGSADSYEVANWVVVGLPFDGTCCFRPGSRFAPAAMREASWGIETYSPTMDREVQATNFYDAGDLDLPFGSAERSLQAIEEAASAVTAAGKCWLGIGGEHLVTYPAVKALVERYPDLVLVQMDAHADLREDYMGQRLSHASVMRRCEELLRPGSLIQAGIRSGTQEEFTHMREHRTLVSSPAELELALEKVEGRPVFLTIDLDVLDPSCFPGTGTPEPGGWLYRELLQFMDCLRGVNLVGADIVELSPPCDPTGCSPVTAASVVRELLVRV